MGEMSHRSYVMMIISEYQWNLFIDIWYVLKLDVGIQGKAVLNLQILLLPNSRLIIWLELSLYSSGASPG